MSAVASIIDPPNLLVLLAQYERLVAYLLRQRDQQADVIEQLTRERLWLLDAAPAPPAIEDVVCRCCQKTFTRRDQGHRGGWAPVCAPCQKQNKARKDHARWVSGHKRNRRPSFSVVSRASSA